MTFLSTHRFPATSPRFPAIADIPARVYPEGSRPAHCSAIKWPLDAGHPDRAAAPVRDAVLSRLRARDEAVRDALG